MTLDQIVSSGALEQLIGYAITLCKNLIIAAIVWWIGKWIVKHLVKIVVKTMERRKADPSLFSFIKSIVSVTLYLLLIIIIISILGIETSSFIALFASAGVAIGMALSGTLQNFAGGVMILLFKPYRVGDFIEAQGFSGTVKEIQIFNTILLTPDNQTIIIPNGGLSTSSMKNYSTEPIRRVDATFSFAYGTDLERVKKELRDIQLSYPLIQHNPEPWVGITSLGDSGVQVTTRSWCATEEYWTVMGYMNETVYQKLKDKGFMFPGNRVNVTVCEKK